MFPRARQMTLKKMWPFWSKSMWAPWAHWVTKEVTSRAKPLEREDKSEKLTLKKKRFNKFAKRRGDKALVHEEYLSEDEEDGDDDDHKGMAAIAMHSKSSSTSSSLFDSPNENKPNT